jgi:hypothetical protein
MRGILFLSVLVCLFLSGPALAQRVIESESTASIEGQTGVFRLALENTFGGKSYPASAELINTEDKVVASAVRTASGDTQTIEFRMPLSETLTSTPNDDLAWYRLRYRVGPASGVISLSQMIRDLFELRITASSNLMAGMTYRVRVRAVNPVTEQPVPGVSLETLLKLDLENDDDGEDLALRNTAETNADGFAVVDFAIPVDARFDYDADLEVTGRKNGVIREAEDDISTETDDVRVLMMSDKPIYQPGQIMNIRGILLKGTDVKTVLAGDSVEFRIEDEDGTMLYREKLAASEYGVAAIGWRIPTNAKLGQYSIEVRDEEGDVIGTHRARVSRYDLPNFVVHAKPSKPYYLPEDKQAEIEVRADYLFGKPVTKGKVRVVQEKSREWDWKEQKYEVEEGEHREGEADAAGKFRATFDLTEAHENIDEDEQYRDINFAAYFTDATTNKTEQRRFDIRVTREPIHVYLIRSGSAANARLPLEGYVSTYFADGTPAECKVDVRASAEDEDEFKTFATVKTNALGAGKFSMRRPAIDDPDDDLDFVISARSADGRRGTARRTVRFDDDDGLALWTDRTIYKPGETMNVRIASTIKTGLVYVDIARGWSVIDSRFARLVNGKATLQIPYRQAFAGELKIGAFIDDPDDEDENIRTSRGVLFPAKQGMSVEANFDRAVYKPNDEATLKFNLFDVSGKSVDAALGVVIFDKAVEERARTDSEFGDMFRGLSGWLGYGAQFGGINIKDLRELDLSKPISKEMQLVGEIILHDTYYQPNTFRSSRYHEQARSVFAGAIARQFQRVDVTLKNAYEKRNYLHPVGDASFRAILRDGGVGFDAMTDPWSTPYRAEFGVEKARDLVTVKSAGPDKTFGTRDDFTAYTAGFEYFTPTGRSIDTAVRAYNSTTGDFIRDRKVLVEQSGVGELIDRYGRPYEIISSGEGRVLRLRIKSAGPDGKLETYDWAGDDFYVWESQIDFFSVTEGMMRKIQSEVIRAPMNEVEFKASLKAGGIDFDALRDAGGNPLHIVAERRTRSREKVTFETVVNFGDVRRVDRQTITPVTQDVMQFTIRTAGRDSKVGTYDDVTLTQIVHVLSERSTSDAKPVIKQVAYYANAGSIAGTVTDPNGAVVPGAPVTATNTVSNQERSVTTNDEGRFLIVNLAPGIYNVRASAVGFRDTVIQSVTVTSGVTSSLNIELNAAAVSEVVTVTAGADAMVNSTNASLSTVTARQITELPMGARASALVALQLGATGRKKSPTTDLPEADTDRQTSTPRLREYFPETLLWQPQLVTDSAGRAEVKFRLADNITTWKMYTIASTKSGQIGFVEKEITAFQSFFVDLDPPKFLTVGDEIFLPTQVRNYTDAKQNVNVTMSKNDWFDFLDPETKQISVASGESENAVFGFRASRPAVDGRQRVTAMADRDSDAIERPVTVRPDGREVVRTDSRYVTGDGRIDIDFPGNALPGTPTAELKLYPNLMAHVGEAVEGLLRRPYGCGEQTISSTYPNLMILKFAGEESSRRISPTVERQAAKYLRSGYERLLGYQVANGGFSYWGGKDEADFALTAYALRFLSDASRLIEVDPTVVKRAEDWLVGQQGADGSWGTTSTDAWAEEQGRVRTTYVARTLAMLQASRRNVEHAGKESDATPVSLTRALDHLRKRNAGITDPYTLALFGLAALDAGDKALAQNVGTRLASLAKTESGGAYWNLESNTAFNGWGTAGRIETTALVTQLLTRLDAHRDLAARGILYLLKTKDRYGVWHSTQTTINVLDAFIASGASEARASAQVRIVVNGQVAQTIDIGADTLDQIIVNLSGKLRVGKNTIELQSTSRTPFMANLVATHFVDWNAASVTAVTPPAFRFDYRCDRTSAAIMQEISCSVQAERNGYARYGMLLAEIGTPPGADVDRESLQAAMAADPSISRYEILPDRVVLYLWSKAGGTKFNFKFRPRYGINAQTPASTVYDYYNPEAQAVVAPLRFSVK